MRVIRVKQELVELVGEKIGISDWIPVTQTLIDDFANASGDSYWIHTDPVKAMDTKFASTIAHGLLVLSLGPAFMYKLIDFSAFGTTLNYGFESVRFPEPLPVGANVRMKAHLLALEEKPAGLLVKVRQTFESDRSERPVCVARSLLYLTESTPAR